MLSVLQWILNIVLAIYIFKGLLGKFSDGDFTKTVLLAIAWFDLLIFKSLVLKN